MYYVVSQMLFFSRLTHETTRQWVLSNDKIDKNSAPIRLPIRYLMERVLTDQSRQKMKQVR